MELCELYTYFNLPAMCIVDILVNYLVVFQSYDHNIHFTCDLSWI